MPMCSPQNTRQISLLPFAGAERVRGEREARDTPTELPPRERSDQEGSEALTTLSASSSAHPLLQSYRISEDGATLARR